MANMSRIINILGITLIFFFSIALSNEWIIERKSDIYWGTEGIDVPRAIEYNGTDTKITPALDGRSLVDSWLNPRTFVCKDQGWQVCATQFGCCPTAQLCCTNIPYCKNSTTDTCCSISGICPVGYECTSLCRCIETGGECCSNGQYCQKGNICVISPYGVYGCCTDLKCTAYVTNGATVPLTPTYTPTRPVTTRSPEPTITQAVYYYFTITWSYYFYYYFTFYEEIIAATTSTLTSSYTTVYTTTSLYGFNAADASSSFNSVSSAFVPPSAPAAATTALATPTAAPSTPSSPATGAGPTSSATFSLTSPTSPSFSRSSSSSAAAVSSINTSLRSSGGGTSSGAVAAPQVLGATATMAVVLAVIALVPGMGMLLL